MIRNWNEFETLARDWAAAGGDPGPGLPLTPETFLAAAYDSWLAVLSETGERRTLASFDARLREFYPKGVPTLFRKLKGTIRPKQDELEKLIVALFAPDTSKLTSKRRRELETFATSMRERLFNRQPDFVEDSTAVWILASRGAVIVGPEDHTRDETFRTLMANRLHAAYNSSEPPPAGVPLTLWLIDVSSLRADGEAAYVARRALTVLASSIMASLAAPLQPPVEKPSLEYAADRQLASGPSNVRIAIRGAPGAKRWAEDLRPQLRQSSVVCMTGFPLEDPSSQLVLEGADEEDFFASALLPDSLLSEKLAESGARKADVNQVLELSVRHEVCLGTKIPLQQVSKISSTAPKPLAELEVVQRELELDPVRYLYWLGSGEGGQEVREHLFPPVEASVTIRTAIFAILVAAAARLRQVDVQSENSKSQLLSERTIGLEMIELVRSRGVKVMTIDEFLNFSRWLDAAARVAPGQPRN